LPVFEKTTTLQLYGLKLMFVIIVVLMLVKLVGGRRHNSTKEH